MPHFLSAGKGTVSALGLLLQDLSSRKYLFCLGTNELQLQRLLHLETHLGLQLQLGVIVFCLTMEHDPSLTWNSCVTALIVAIITVL